MSNNQRDYLFIENTTSLCAHCLQRVDAKIIQKDNKIFILKYCLEHGEQEEILEENAEYFLNRMAYTKPGTMSKTQTERKNGCPFDCGLCPEHDQHTCIGLIEVTEQCDLKCPMCYASSGCGNHLPLEKIEKMIDLFVDSEHGQAEILQISGGEPTMHPQVLEIIGMAKEKGVKYVMLNTNGLRLAEDEEFVKQLGQFQGGFEVYLQFDGFSKTIFKHMRGKENLFETKEKAMLNLTKYKIPTTLVATIERGVNDGELGKIIEYGLRSEYVRGINFQPIAFFGRLRTVDTKNRITMTGVIEEIGKQMGGMILKSDFFPLPCDVDRVALTYLYRTDGSFVPLTRNLNIKEYLPVIQNTFQFNPENFLQEVSNKMLSSSESCCDYLSILESFKKFIPTSYFSKSPDEKRAFINQNIFRISVTSFVDVYNFDMKSMKKECVHVITPELKKIPFSSFNMIHRERMREKEKKQDND